MTNKESTNTQEMQPLVTVENLCKHYAKRGFATRLEEPPALDGVSFTIFPGTTLAVVGESGCGKSTLALCLVGLESPTAGDIWFQGVNIVTCGEGERRQVRPHIQLIFQDPASSLNPKWSVFEILVEPLMLQDELSREEMKHRAYSLLERVSLSPEIASRPPAELSGGQRQRLAIARALALEPKLLIMDEALSALDCSVQAEMANLLMELQDSLGMAYLFITHDLVMAAHLADEIAVMNRGRIVERGTAAKIFSQPSHETTRQLVASMPRLSRVAHPALER